MEEMNSEIREHIEELCAEIGAISGRHVLLLPFEVYVEVERIANSKGVPTQEWLTDAIEMCVIADGMADEFMDFLNRRRGT